MFYSLIAMQVYTFARTHQTLYFKWVSFTVFKLHLNKICFKNRVFLRINAPVIFNFICNQDITFVENSRDEDFCYQAS